MPTFSTPYTPTDKSGGFTAFFDNAEGEFNVSYWRYKHFNTSVVTRAHSELLGKAKRMNTDSSEVLSLYNPGDFVFIDPLYDCVFPITAMARIFPRMIIKD